GRGSAPADGLEAGRRVEAGAAAGRRPPDEQRTVGPRAVATQARPAQAGLAIRGSEAYLAAAAAAFFAAFFSRCLTMTATGPGTTLISPPAFSIFSAADLLKRWALILSFLVSSPSPR